MAIPPSAKETLSGLAMKYFRKAGRVQNYKKLMPDCQGSSLYVSAIFDERSESLEPIERIKRLVAAVPLQMRLAQEILAVIVCR